MNQASCQTNQRFLRRLIFAPYERISENLSGWNVIIQDVVLTERPGFNLNIEAEL